MTNGLPHSSIVAAQFEQYLEDCKAALVRSIDHAKQPAELRGVYKVCLAAYCVLSKFGHRNLVLLKAAAEIVRRLPLHVSANQLSSVHIELRRFIELLSWYAYFVEHPVEWAEFSESPGQGFSRDLERPIAFCAHRERNFYSNYINERFKAEKSHLVLDANATLSKSYNSLSFHVHGASETVVRSEFKGVVGSYDQAENAKMQALLRDVLSAGCILSAAANPKKIHRLDVYERAWFDWLIGNTRSKTIRSGSFCSL